MRRPAHLRSQGSTVNEVWTATSNCTKMACSTDCKGSSRTPHSSWTVDKLKEFLKEKGLSTIGKKSELVRRVSGYIELESELGAVAFSDLQVKKPIAFEELPSSNCSKAGLPEVSVERVCTYLKRMGAYTKNYRTGVRICQCGHVYDVEWTCLGPVIFVRAKYRPTMLNRDVGHSKLISCFSSCKVSGFKSTRAGG